MSEQTDGAVAGLEPGRERVAARRPGPARK